MAFYVEDANGKRTLIANIGGNGGGQVYPKT